MEVRPLPLHARLAHLPALTRLDAMEVLAVGAPPQQPDDVAVPEVAQHLHLGESGGRRSVRLQASAPHGHDGEHHAHAHALEQRDAALDAGEPAQPRHHEAVGGVSVDLDRISVSESGTKYVSLPYKICQIQVDEFETFEIVYIGVRGVLIQ